MNVRCVRSLIGHTILFSRLLFGTGGVLRKLGGTRQRLDRFRSLSVIFDKYLAG